MHDRHCHFVCDRTREAGALLPQIALARRVEASPQRKRFWAADSAVQGIAALGIAGAALLLSGAAAGGAITGLAASVAAVSVFGVGLLMAAGLFEVAVAPLAAIIALARAKPAPAAPAAVSRRLVGPMTGPKGRSRARLRPRKDRSNLRRLIGTMAQITPSMRMDSATRTKPAIFAPRT